MSFKNLKKTRSNISDLANKLQAGGKKQFEKDERLWYPKRDENGNGFAVIRFMPPADDDDVSFVQTFRHGFQAKNGWYIEECPTTIGQQCPVCTANSNLYETEGKEIASRTVSGQNGRKRKMQYLANIYVKSDPESPENEGKIFLFKFGARIFEKITSAVSPDFKDEEAIDPFHLYEGADFTLKIRKVDGNVNYDSSSFAASAPLLDDEKALEVAYDSLYNLSAEIAPDKYKSYADLEKKFNRVVGNSQPDAANDSAQEAAPASQAAPAASLVDEGEEGDTLEYFEKLKQA